jgi:hypothetical protein
MHALRRPSTADRLAGAAGLVAAIAAILRFVPGVYRDPRPLVVQSNGQDFATLLVGLPVLGPLTLLDTTVVGLAAWSLALADGALLSITAFAAADGQARRRADRDLGRGDRSRCCPLVHGLGASGPRCRVPKPAERGYAG